jgi:cytochrome c biogenesis protein CcmG, thiol:disulfide interchange protein DsbE
MTQARRLQIAVGLVGGVLAGLLLVIAVAMARGVGGPIEGRVSTGLGPASPFTLQQFEHGEGFTGHTIALPEYADQPVFIYFWASWCIPCEEEAQVIERLWPEYRNRGWVFLGVNIWDAESDAQRFIERLDLSFPLVRDVERSVYVDYGVQALPVAFFVAPGLDIYARYDGLLTEQALRDLLDEAPLPAAGVGMRRS